MGLTSLISGYLRGGTATLPAYQEEVLRFRKGKSRAQGPRASEWYCWDARPGLHARKARRRPADAALLLGPCIPVLRC